MMLNSWFQRIFPPPRRPVSVEDAIPLIGFLVVFTLICLTLELGDYVLFTRPWWLAAILITPWFWWMNAAGYSGLTGRRALVALMVRLVVVALFVILLAEPRAVRQSDRVSVGVRAGPFHEHRFGHWRLSFAMAHQGGPGKTGAR